MSVSKACVTGFLCNHNKKTLTHSQIPLNFHNQTTQTLLPLSNNQMPKKHKIENRPNQTIHILKIHNNIRRKIKNIHTTKPGTGTSCTKIYK